MPSPSSDAEHHAAVCQALRLYLFWKQNALFGTEQDNPGVNLWANFTGYCTNHGLNADAVVFHADEAFLALIRLPKDL